MFLTKKAFIVVTVVAMVWIGMAIAASAETWQQSFLPVLMRGGSHMQEVRALWVTRFDWTNINGADPAKIDEIVANASSAGFNVLYFQIRAEADAYYLSSLEPWSKRLSGTLGEDPGWDPLAYMIQKAHASGLQVHAYMNVYPLWTGCTEPPDDTNPQHLYYKLRESHGISEGKVNGVQWNSAGEVICDPYMRVSPASIAFDNHLQAVVEDLAQRYDIDGVHLDHIRYAGADSSCDPVSEERFEGPCSKSDEYADWQRQQIDGTVRKLHEQIVARNPDLWLTAAVWPVYRDIYGWGASSGYDKYYQDSKAWLTGDYIDGISPMIYSGSPNCSGPYFWTRERWATLVAEFQADSNGNFVVPGIGTAYCTDDDFAEIEARIKQARAEGTAGHAIYSYKSLLLKDYFYRLAKGPYAVPADVPPLPRNS